MYRFKSILALCLALILAIASLGLPAMAEEEAAPDTGLLVVEPVAEDSANLVVEPADTLPIAPVSPPPFAELPLTEADQMPAPGEAAKAEAIVTAPTGADLFELPSHGSAILTHLEAASVLELLTLGRSWSKVSSAGKEGWVPTLALSFAFGAKQPNLAIVTAPLGKLTLRAQMSTKAKALGTLHSGRAVLLLAKGKTFSLVRHEGKEGYALTAHLKEVAPRAELGIYTQVISVVTTREANVRLRADAARNAPVYTSVKSGLYVVVLGTEEGWAQVEYEGYHGYMMADYLKKFD